MTLAAALNVAIRAYCSKAGSRPNGRLKIALLGAAGQTGQPLALMLKNSPLVDSLALYDKMSTQSLCEELSHIDTRCYVCSRKNRLKDALDGAQIVVITACAPGVSMGDLPSQLNPNAAIMLELMASVARYCSKALVAIATEPINSMVPIASEVMKRFRAYDPSKIFGVTTLDVMRANIYAARTAGLSPERVHVPVLGGHSEKTIVPVLSRMQPYVPFSETEIHRIIDHVQSASENLEKIKRHDTLALSSAFAIARFVQSLARACKGETGVLEYAYVRYDHSVTSYLVTPIELGPGGIQKNLGIPPLSDAEESLLQNAALLLREDITAGENLVAGKTHRSFGSCPHSCNCPE